MSKQDYILEVLKNYRWRMAFSTGMPIVAANWILYDYDNLNVAAICYALVLVFVGLALSIWCYFKYRRLLERLD